jgi:RNA polymerase sigma-70 factor (ECF subfamily)
LPVTNLSNLVNDLSDFEAVVQGNRHRVFRFLLSSLRDPDLAETLTQECFLKAYKARHRFRGEAQVSTWLTTIAVNLVRDHYRSKRKRFWSRLQCNSLELADISEWLPDNGRTAEQQAVARSQVNIVSRAVERLPTAERTVFLLRYVEDFDLKQIGQSTGMTRGSIKSNLYRALKHVRKQLMATNIAQV